MIDMDDISPHHTMDGNWGGWCAPLWFYGYRFGFQESDVLEREETDTGYRWAKIWENEKNKWRNLTTEEILALPSANDA